MIFSDVTKIEMVVVLLAIEGRIYVLIQDLSIVKELKILFLTYFCQSKSQISQTFSIDLQTKLSSVN